MFYKYIKGVFVKYDELDLLHYLRNELQKPQFGLWSSNREEEYHQALKRECTYTKGLNINKDYINLGNGMLNLKNLELYEHDPAFYSAIQLPFEYDPNAKCPKFLSFLKEVFEGDVERIRLTQEWLGYFISSKMNAQKMLILYGQGSNGKGVLSQIIEELVGADNVCASDLDSLNKAFTRATLLNKLIIMSSENELSNKSLNTQWVKAIVGGDRIQAEFKGKDGFSFIPTTKICISTNNLPFTKDTSEGYYRRICILCFNRNFNIQGGKADTNLIHKLKKEMPGILNFALEGLKRLIESKYKFSPCESSEKILKEYRIEQDPILGYIDECLNIDENISERETNYQIIESFRAWARKNGHKGYADISTKRFWRNFDIQTKAKGYTFIKRKHSNNDRYCLGVRVNDEFRVYEKNRSTAKSEKNILEDDFEEFE